MKSEWMITLLTAGGILILCAAMIIWDKIRQRKWFLRHLKQRWGTVPDREYTQEELESISHYAKRNEGEQFMIDDITWNDLQMDEIFYTYKQYTFFLRRRRTLPDIAPAADGSKRVG